MSEEEKKRMNYESRQRKGAKKAALKEQADKGKGQPVRKVRAKQSPEEKANQPSPVTPQFANLNSLAGFAR